LTISGNGLLKEGTTVKGIIHRVKANGQDNVTFTVGQPGAFKLANDDYLEIAGLPYGTLYTVTEASASGYTTVITATATTETVTNDDNKYDAFKDAQNTPIAEGGNTITYTNNRELVKTGVVLDFAPYFAILLVAIGGAAAFLASRKRRTNR
jgi:hypothetical protein